jgi:hypothetical protein
MNPKISPRPSLRKRGKIPPFGKGRVRRDFINNVVIIMRLLIKGVTAMKNMRFPASGAKMKQVVQAR